MSKKLHLFICENFRAETKAVLDSGEYEDVMVSFFPTRCGHPSMAKQSLSQLPELNQVSLDAKMVCGCSCLTPGDRRFLDDRDVVYLDQATCFEMFAPPDMIQGYLNEGSYLVTPGWLPDWQTWVAEWGDQEQARGLFAETISRLTFLDTGVLPGTADLLAELSAYVDRPFETIPVGLAHYRLSLENRIYKWRVSEMKPPAHQGRSGPAQNADYAMALDLLTNLVHKNEEEVVARQIMEIFSMLFAARKIYYLSVVDGEPGPLWTLPDGLQTEAVVQRLSSCDRTISSGSTDTGFCLKISTGDDLLAVVEVEELLMPEINNQYQNLALAMSGVFALSLEKARYHRNMMDMNASLTSLNATKDKFFSIIAHDLKSPFGTVIGFCDLLIDRLQQEKYDKAEEIAEITKRTAERAMALLMNLLEWARSQTGRMEYRPREVKISSLLADVLELMHETAQKKSILLLPEQVSERSVLADQAMISTVLRNLISNAIKFTNPGGRVFITGEDLQGEYRVTVRDDGIGIPEGDLPRLFKIEESVSTHGTQNEQGTGLGLILCHEFIEKHGGRIWAESKVGEGSRFIFSIPHQEGNPPQQA